MNVLSNTSAMPGKSYGTTAGPGRCPIVMLKESRKGNQSVCSRCYAGGGRFLGPTVMNAHEARWQWWHETPPLDVVAIMTHLIRNQEFFRMYHSGDGCHVMCLWMWVLIVRQCPGTQFWFPTRTWALPKFHMVLRALHREPNCVVRLSNMHFDEPVPMDVRRELGIDTVSFANTTRGCPKQAPGVGSCDKAGCRNCWDKDVKVVPYKDHGKNVNWKRVIQSRVTWNKKAAGLESKTPSLVDGPVEREKVNDR